MKIQSRIFIHGDKCESTWPSDFGTLERGVFHMDENGECQKGYPASKIQKFGEAPYIIQDSIEPYYHPALGRTVDTRGALRDADNACGTITTDKKIPPDPSKQNALRKERARDLSESLRRAVGQIDAGNAPLTEEQRAKCDRNNEILAAANPHLDPFNAVGRISNAKGKRYKRKHSIG